MQYCASFRWKVAVVWKGRATRKPCGAKEMILPSRVRVSSRGSSIALQRKTSCPAEIPETRKTLLVAVLGKVVLMAIGFLGASCDWTRSKVASGGRSHPGVLGWNSAVQPNGPGEPGS